MDKTRAMATTRSIESFLPSILVVALPVMGISDFSPFEFSLLSTSAVSIACSLISFSGFCPTAFILEVPSCIEGVLELETELLDLPPPPPPLLPPPELPPEDPELPLLFKLPKTPKVLKCSKLASMKLPDELTYVPISDQLPSVSLKK